MESGSKEFISAKLLSTNNSRGLPIANSLRSTLPGIDNKRERTKTREITEAKYKKLKKELAKHKYEENHPYIELLDSHLNYITHLILLCLEYLTIDFCIKCGRFYPSRFKCIKCHLLSSNRSVFYIPYGSFTVRVCDGLFHRAEFHCNNDIDLIKYIIQYGTFDIEKKAAQVREFPVSKYCEQVINGLESEKFKTIDNSDGKYAFSFLIDKRWFITNGYTKSYSYISAAINKPKERKNKTLRHNEVIQRRHNKIICKDDKIMY